jgi:nicotinic acid phosphoribosyltransferase
MRIFRTLGSVALIITFITGIWFIDDRYVDAKEVQSIKEQIYLRIDTNEYRELTKQYYELKKLVRENPDSEELKEQLKEVEKERAELKKRIDAKLE